MVAFGDGRGVPIKQSSKILDEQASEKSGLASANCTLPNENIGELSFCSREAGHELEDEAGPTKG